MTWTWARLLRQAAGALAALGALTVAVGCSAPVPPESRTTTANAVAPSAVVTPTVDPDQERRDGLGALLARRAAALAARDRPGWLATLDDPASPFGQRQAGLFDRLVQLPISGYTEAGIIVAPALDPARAAAVGPGAWAGTAQIAYSFAGYDRGSRTFAASFTLVRRPSGWRLADDADGATQVQPWDLPGMSAVSSARSLVIGNVPRSQLQSYLTLADAAAARIAPIWGSAANAVLVAPETTEQLTAQLGRPDPGGLDQVAAVTDGPLVPQAPAPGDRVYLNPQAFGRLTADGRRVVITHELTHVAVRASTTRGVPIWLSEGFADYVGFSGLGIPATTVAADLLAKVRAGTGPRALPTEGDFDPSRGPIAPTYNAAWLAVTRIAQTRSPARTVQFYQAVAGAMPVDPSVANDPEAVARQAFSTVLGTTQDAFVADWLAYLRRLAGAH